MSGIEQRIIIVSNRLPIVLEKTDTDLNVKSGSGGLVTALAPVLRNRGGLWIGWPGIFDVDEKYCHDALNNATEKEGYFFEPVLLDQNEVDLYYYGFSNEIIWPLFHDLQSRCNFDPRYWQAYVAVNRKFAEKIIQNRDQNDYVWVHDYQLMMVAKELRELNHISSIGFFLHIPFPPLDIFLKLPWRFQILRALLDFDLLGFQTMRDRRNFIQCVRTLLKDVHVTNAKGYHLCMIKGREVRIGCFPISIDFNEFARLAATKDVADGAWYIHEHLPNCQIIFGIDRLDYTKGIPLRLEAFRNVLQRYPEMRGKVTLVQVVVPSRINIPEYMDLKIEVERLVGEINGQYSTSGWIPVLYIFRSLDRKELASYYRTAEIALITPIKDGMNLVAKEYCASALEENGVLILSEFAGAAAQLHRYALLVNPYDLEGIADMIYHAYKMPLEERRTRMKRMRSIIRRQDIFWWVESFLQTAFAKELVDFPAIEEYLPSTESKDL